MKVRRRNLIGVVVVCAFVCMGYGIPVSAQTVADSLAIAQCPWDTVYRSDGLVVTKAQLQLYDTPQAIVVAVADTKKMGFHVAQPGKRCRKVSRQAADHGAEIAVNGGFFAIPRPDPIHYVQVDGEAVDPALLAKTGGGMVGVNDERVTVQRWDSAQVACWRDILVSGGFLLEKGKILVPASPDRHPRTLIGVDGERVLLVAVDGRSPGRATGMTPRECAFLMQQLGASQALNLDGGGSTTLWLKERGVVNRPCGGLFGRGERRVGSIVYAVAMK